jgi:hypothetical protein
LTKTGDKAANDKRWREEQREALRRSPPIDQVHEQMLQDMDDDVWIEQNMRFKGSNCKLFNRSCLNLSSLSPLPHSNLPPFPLTQTGDKAAKENRWREEEKQRRARKRAGFD